MWRNMIRRSRQPERPRRLDVRARALLERRAADRAVCRTARRAARSASRRRSSSRRRATPTTTIATSSAGQRVHQVDPAHDHRVDPAAAVAGEEPERCCRSASRRARPGSARASAVRAPDEHPREDVAAEVVGAEPVVARRPDEARLEILRVRIDGRDQVAEERKEDDRAEEPERERRCRARSAVAAERGAAGSTR